MNALVSTTLLVILLSFAALTAACEIAMVAVSRLRLRKLSSEGSKTAKTILHILEVPERFFSTMLVTNNIVGALIAVLVTEMVIRVFGISGSLDVIISTVVASVLIIVSEVTAKTIATQYPEKISFLLARPINIFVKVFSPVVAIFAFITEKIVRLVGAQKKGKVSLVSAEEIRTLIKIGEEEGILNKEESGMLSRIFDLRGTIVKKVMTPRTEMTSIDVVSKFDDIVDKVSESGYSRIPVYKDKPENIIGLINSKDLLNLSVNRDLILLQDIIYPATFVSQDKKVSELLKEFQKGHTHLAIVVDSDGKAQGVVTLEDLLEEIVGEIEDEYDVRANLHKNRK
ncbi:MAG: HlyC/CorC family transporter [Candidatus Omnitrophica bacterium]|nr:HlyC/CorC family transporter [Candidatus Omnitrophota bacterium]